MAKKELKCLRCEYTWISHKEGRVKSCPECKSRKWDTAKVIPVKSELDDWPDDVPMDQYEE